jgi:hypothetical protein
MAKGKEAVAPKAQVPRSPTLCKLSGTPIMGRHKFCSECAPTNSKEALIEAARKGRIAAQTPEVLARLGEKQGVAYLATVSVSQTIVFRACTRLRNLLHLRYLAVLVNLVQVAPNH